MEMVAEMVVGKEEIISEILVEEEIMQVVRPTITVEEVEEAEGGKGDPGGHLK